MIAHHRDCGPLRPFGGRLIDGEGSVLRRARMVCHCLLVETERGLVLVDSGFAREDSDPSRTSLPKAFRALMNPVLDPDTTAHAQVARLGYDPADVRHVVLTHLDLDHAGGLRDFPEAKVHVHGPELRAATTASGASGMRYRTRQWAHGPNWVSYDEPSGQDWFGFQAVRDLDGLPEDLLLVPLGGHTTGHVGVAVNTGSTWLLHAGDAFFSEGELAQPPHCPPALRAFQRSMAVDDEARLSNQSRLRELALRTGEVDLVAAHDPVGFDRHVRASR
ncbi:MBL fold metallo-hydrolase [Saccharopolyspora rhizosphaerae]|uniref:MBL fold metallo-hydrolase n=1 Tax=Saccharopolyspora rhizosphaerae TaxID=2492662 RepID=A0A3R8NZN1_9PSEU|nr:MBL fold metallo-hydrolase [Saccharopolyspora rhizosphaerae]RRO16738.1 MBL fold metallo-hydrolase [Saccharopolyspora rhizosphaerae]